jgi:hypothetical protein
MQGTHSRVYRCLDRVDNDDENLKEASIVLMRLLEDKSVGALARELTAALVGHYEEIRRR